MQNNKLSPEESPAAPFFVREILRDWMIKEASAISEDHYCATWISGLEESLHEAIIGLPKAYHYGFGEIEPGRLQRLKQVSEFLGEWFRWDYTAKKPTIIPLK